MMAKKKSAKRTTKKKTKKTTSPELPALVVDRVCLLLVKGYRGDQLRRALEQELGDKAGNVERLIREARRRLTIAADYNRDEEIGLAIARFNDCYKQAYDQEETGKAIQAERERCKLLDLYQPAEAGGVGDELRGELDRALAHLVALKLTKAEAPIDEHARRAAAEIVTLRARG